MNGYYVVPIVVFKYVTRFLVMSDSLKVCTVYKVLYDVCMDVCMFVSVSSV